MKWRKSTPCIGLVLTEIHQKLDEETRQIQELEELEDTLASQYLANMSIFQSGSGPLGLSGQLLPIVPLTRLHEKPEVRVSRLRILPVTVTVRLANISRTTRLATISLCTDCSAAKATRLVCSSPGAYQDVMGDMHNLFGRLTESSYFLVTTTNQVRSTLKRSCPATLPRKSSKPCSTTRTTWRKW